MWRKWLAILCTASVLMCSVPIVAFAQDGVSTAEMQTNATLPMIPATEETDDEILSLIIGEDESLREEYVKYYRREDGATVAAVYGEPVHYSQNGVWEEIDNTLVLAVSDSAKPTLAGNLSPAISYYTNRANNVQMRLPSRFTEGAAVSVTYEGFTVSFLPENALASLGTAAQPNSMTHDASLRTASMTRAEVQAENDRRTALPEQRSSMTYANLWSGVTARYTLQGQTLKEELVFRSAPTQTAFSFILRSGGLTPVLQENGEIWLYKSGSDTPLLSIQSPYMVDAAGVYGSVEVALTPVDGGWRYTLTPDRAWLQDASREYPVMLDPTVRPHTSYRNTNDAQVGLDYLTAADIATLRQDSERIYMYLGYKYFSTGQKRLAELIYTPTPSGITSSSRLINAKLYLSVYRAGAAYTGGAMQTNIYRVTASWGEGNFTQADQVINSDAIPAYDAAALDAALVDDTAASADRAKVEYDITKAAQMWIDGSAANYGLFLKAETYPQSYSVTRFYDSDNGEGNLTGMSPCVVYTYRDAKGVEGTWTYTSMPAGRSGVAAVNNYNGNLIVTQPIAGASGNRMPVQLQMVYNSSGFANADRSVGTDWRLNYHVTLTAVDTDTDLYTAGYLYYLTDADGTDHYFRFEKDASGAWETTAMDEDNLGYTLTVGNLEDDVADDPKSVKYTITDRNDGVMTFNAGGVLNSIADSNGNTAYITLTWAAKSAVIANIVDGAGRLYNFNYGLEHGSTTSKLTKITAPDGAVTSFYYSGDHLARIVYPDGGTVYFYYYNGHLEEISNTDSGLRVRISSLSLGGPYRVGGLAMKHTDLSGAITDYGYAFAYKHNHTTVTETVSNRSVSYQFNDWGQTVCVIDETTGYAEYYEYGKPGAADGTTNRLLSASKWQSSTQNLLRCGDGTSLTGWSVTTTGSGTSYGGGVNTRGRSDGAGYSLTTTGVDGEVSLQSEVLGTAAGITAGSYTASAYIDTASTVSAKALYLDVLSADGTLLRSAGSHVVPHSNTSAWERVCATVDVAEGEQLRVRMTIPALVSGSLYFDDIQLERGEVANSVNLITDPTLRGGVGAWGTAASAATVDGATALKLSGNYKQAVTASHTAAIAGSAGDVYSFGSWAKADAINPNVEAIEGQLAGINAGTPEFSVAVSFYNGTAQVGDRFTAHFNYGTGQWQMAAGVAIAPADYTSVRLEYRYDYNLNTAYFRAPYLYRENFGETYTYDENGNVISSVDLAETEASFAYQDDRLSMLCNPTGSRYLYSYDAGGNTVGAVSSSGAPNGLQYTFSYDTYGNPLYSEIGSGGTTALPTDDTEYFILSAMNGQALVHEYMMESTYATVRPWTRTTAFRWRLESVGDGFKLVSVTREVNSSSPSKKYLQVSETTEGEARFVVSTAANVSEQTFTFSPNLDGSYRILSAYGALDACHLGAKEWSEGTAVTAQTADPDEVTQKWYLVPVWQETASTISTSAGYNAHLDTIRGLSSTVSAGSEYYLLNAATGQAIGGNVPITWSETPQEPFVFNDLITVLAAGSAENTYFVSKKSNTSSFLRISMAGIELYPAALYMSGTNASYQHEFVLQADGSYLLRSAYSPQHCLDIRPEGLYYNKYIANSLSQRWYAVPVTAENTAALAALDFEENGNYQTAVLDAAGNMETSRYDADTGLLQSVTDASGNTTSYTYDDAYRILRVLSGESDVNYTYQNDQLSRIGTDTTLYGFTYDGYRRPTLTQILSADGTAARTLATNTYNTLGLLERLTYGNGAAVTYAYDSLDRTKSVSFVNANGVASPAAGYAYLADGSLGLFKDYLANARTRYTYDLAGRLVGIRETAGATVDSGALRYGASYVYEDGQNRLASVTRTIGGVGSFTDGYTYDERDLLSRVDFDDGLKVVYTYDAFGRPLQTAYHIGGSISYESFSYGVNADGSQNGRLVGYGSFGHEYAFTYDANGNILTVTKDGVLTSKYAYDGLNQMTYEASADSGTTTVYTYDTSGNILQKAVYAGYDTTEGTPEITLYTYGDDAWGDLLTAYNGNAITYDQIGNPLTWYDGRTFTWQRGRQLASTAKNGVTASYTYNADGMRITKTVNGASTEYVYDGGKLIAAKTDDEPIVFRLDASGKYVGFEYGSETYLYMRNMQGDIVGIRTESAVVARYTYDAWGKVLSVTDASGTPITDSTHIAHVNPIRYRGYYYDTETGLYYVSSRYYDPEIGRFINADDIDYLGADGSPLSYNLFAYCMNNPVNRFDVNGNWSMPNWLKVAVGAVAIAGLAVATVYTGGAAAVICGAALSGAIAGGASGAVMGAIGGAISGGLQGALDGACSGFMSGTLIGGATGAASAGLNIATGATTVVGNAHGSILHKLATNMEAGKMAASGQYSQIGINKSLGKMGLNGGLTRPDVIGIGKNGVNKLVEVVSPRQSTTHISNKMSNMLSNNPGTVGKIVNWVRRLFK